MSKALDDTHNLKIGMPDTLCQAFLYYVRACYTRARSVNSLRNNRVGY